VHLVKKLRVSRDSNQVCSTIFVAKSSELLQA
jgi:hypothetical protein